MQHSKILKRNNGQQYEITINMYTDSYNHDTGIEWKIMVFQREKGKRKWAKLPDLLCDWEFRSLSMEERRAHILSNTLRFVSKAEILEAKIELWNKIKPVI